MLAMRQGFLRSLDQNSVNLNQNSMEERSLTAGVKML